MKPLHISNKIIEDNLEKILLLYQEGISIQDISKQFKVNTNKLLMYIPQETKNNPRNIPIICITTGEEFVSTAAASRKLKISAGCIWRVINGGRIHTRGLKFKYK